MTSPTPREHPGQPHGLATGTAAAIITLLSSAIERGRGLGAVLVGDYTKLQRVELLAIHRKRPPRKGPCPHTSLDDIVAVCAFLTVTCQLAVWLMRLVGLRIGEAYGLFVSDYQCDGSRAWLAVETQGGKKSLASPLRFPRRLSVLRRARPASPG